MLILAHYRASPHLLLTSGFLSYSSSFTKLPHLAGTEQNLLLAKQIQGQWKEFGLDSAELVHYDVLLSYPNETQPNYISVIDDEGSEVIFLRIKLHLCKTSLKKPVSSSIFPPQHMPYKKLVQRNSYLETIFQSVQQSGWNLNASYSKERGCVETLQLTPIDQKVWE